MSNALAIAAVTAVLKDLLDNSLIDNQATTTLGKSVNVSAIPPDRVFPGGQNEDARLNLFLYHVVTNPGWKNVDLPSHTSDGERTSNPPLALDLYYLLTAYGENNFEAEILLGYAMQLLHEKPILTRQDIHNSLDKSNVPNAGILPVSVNSLSAADLAGQVELIKLTFQPLATEELSKLWSALQSKYRPSVAYQASVVLIESQNAARAALPVLTRGYPNASTGRDRGVVTQASLLPAYPTLQSADPPDKQSAIRMGEVLTVGGLHLDGDNVMARFTYTRSSMIYDLPPQGTAAAAGFSVLIPQNPAAVPVTGDSPLNPDNWQAGLYSVAAVIQTSDQGGMKQVTTNELPVILAPQVQLVEQKRNAPGDPVILTATCSPKIRRGQRVTLVVGDLEIPPEPITQDQTDQLTFNSSITDLPPGKYWYRLRVDGIESILVDRTGTLPKFDDSQQVTIT